MAKKAKNMGRVIDYYVMYGLDQNASARNNKKRLREIQADIRTAMSDGSLNGEEILSKLQEQNDEVVLAIKCFKNEETKAEYDKRLEVAYKKNNVDVEAQKLSQELFEEIAALFAKQRYQQVITKCVEAINNNVRDVRLYEYMAKSYRLLGDAQHALEAVENGLKVESKNTDLLKVGSRVYTDNLNNYDEAQKYINQMFGIDKSAATAEQIHLYMNFDKKDIAYQTLDDYLADEPNDISFCQQCAYDFVGLSNRCYEDCIADDGTEVSLILDEESYQQCLEYCQKAVSLYQDENTKNALEYAQHFGQVEFNEDNASDLKWDYGATVLMGFLTIFSFMFMVEEAEIMSFVLCMGLFSVCLYVTLGFRKASYRPYWQIYKYIFTGEREKREQKFLILGKILSGFIRLIWWGTKTMIKFCMDQF